MARDLVLGPTNRDWSCGLMSATTEDVDDRLNSLLTDTNNLNDDVSEWYRITNKTPEKDRFIRAWINWRDSTYKFINSWKSGSFFKIKFAWNYLDNANSHLHELTEWRKRWENISGKKATAPGSNPPRDNSFSFGLNLPTLGIGAASLFSLGYLVKSFRGK